MKIVLPFFSFVLLTLPVAHAEPPKFDILITAKKFDFSPNLQQISLYSPSINLKIEKGNTDLKSLSVDNFTNLWKSSPEDKKSFAADNPNAILTSWNNEKNYLETSFIIEKTSVQGNKLILDVKYLEGDKAQNSSNALPITIDSQATTKEGLQKFLTSSTGGASVVVIVDSPGGPVDPHPPRH
jgi:hypothetical protein